MQKGAFSFAFSFRSSSTAICNFFLYFHNA
uniref:Uncharacterized protein n=1 Tax=Rhizophora mucronata TaxID=61149 RepID=A0A2P2L5R5_RHIMU